LAIITEATGCFDGDERFENLMDAITQEHDDAEALVFYAIVG
jgi:hypothetical protein